MTSDGGMDDPSAPAMATPTVLTRTDEDSVTAESIHEPDPDIHLEAFVSINSFSDGCEEWPEFSWPDGDFFPMENTQYQFSARTDHAPPTPYSTWPGGKPCVSSPMTLFPPLETECQDESGHIFSTYKQRRDHPKPMDKADPKSSKDGEREDAQSESNEQSVEITAIPDLDRPTMP